MIGALKTASGLVPVWFDATGCRKRIRGVRVTKHGARRFQERVRPDLDLGLCDGELRRLIKTSIVGYRRNMRRDGSWYLLCGGDRPFAVLVAPVLTDTPPVWSVITVVGGHAV